jgi:hypothetical protein
MSKSIALRTTIATHPRMRTVVTVVAAGTLVAAILIMLMTRRSYREVQRERRSRGAG